MMQVRYPSQPPTYDEATFQNRIAQINHSEKQQNKNRIRENLNDFEEIIQTEKQSIQICPRLPKQESFASTSSNTYSTIAQTELGEKSLWIKNPINGIPLSPPIVIPQTTTKLLQKNLTPFSRAYPICLKEIGIEMNEFMKIIDNINECFILNPAFKIIQMAGMMMSFVPSITISGIGTGINIAAGLAGAGMSYTRTKQYIKKVNETIFNPKGLKICIFSTKNMMKSIGQNENERKLKLPPLPQIDLNFNPNSPEIDPRMRRMTALGDKVAQLNWNVSQIVEPEGILQKVGNWQAKKSAISVEKKHIKSYQKAAASSSSQKRIQKIEQKEYKTTKRIRWIVIIPNINDNSDDDDVIIDDDDIDSVRR